MPFATCLRRLLKTSFFLFPTLLATVCARDQQHGFVCATLDWWPSTKCNYAWCPWHNSSVWAIDLNEIAPYAKLLGRRNSGKKKDNESADSAVPFLLRVGGSLQDQYTFQSVCDGENQFPVDANNRLGFGGGCISRRRISELSTFCREVGCSLVWGLNAMNGRNDQGLGAWDSGNARALLEYMVEIEAPLHAVTLGNEVWGEMINLSLDQALDSFAALDRIVGELWSPQERPLIAGLDGYVNRRQFSFLANFTEQVSRRGIRIDVLNYHEYPLGTSNDDHVLERAMSHDPSFHALATKVAGFASPKQQVWMSECGGSENSGSPQATGSYASGFWYLDGMAMLHHAGYQHFCRQTLAGGNYGLLDQVSPRSPHPDFWNAVLYQRLLGKPLDQLQSRLSALVQCEGSTSDHGDPSSHEHVQWYAFESKTAATTSAVAYLGVNFDTSRRCGLVVSNSPTHVTQYILTPGDGNQSTPWNATTSNLNGSPLLDVTASLDGEEITSTTAWLEPLTYGFFVVNDSIMSTTE